MNCPVCNHPIEDHGKAGCNDCLDCSKPVSELHVLLLREALLKAQQHLDYCGYGDGWEHECARSEGLPQLINTALEVTKCA